MIPNSQLVQVLVLVDMGFTYGVATKATLVIRKVIQNTVRRQALHSKWPGYSDLFLVVIRFIEEILELSLRSNGCINFLLPIYTLLPPLGMQCLRLF